MIERLLLEETKLALLEGENHYLLEDKRKSKKRYKKSNVKLAKNNIA